MYGPGEKEDDAAASSQARKLRDSKRLAAGVLAAVARWRGGATPFAVLEVADPAACGPGPALAGYAVVATLLLNTFVAIAVPGGC